MTLTKGPRTNFTYLSNNTLGAGMLGFDNFQVNAMVSVPNSSCIVFGLQNYGIVIYDVLKLEIVRAQPIFNETQCKPFLISSIVVENRQVFHLQILKFGTVSLHYKEFYD